MNPEHLRTFLLAGTCVNIVNQYRSKEIRVARRSVCHLQGNSASAVGGKNKQAAGSRGDSPSHGLCPDVLSPTAAAVAENLACFFFAENNLESFLICLFSADERKKRKNTQVYDRPGSIITKVVACIDRKLDARQD